MCPSPSLPAKDIAFFDGFRTGDLLERLSEDTEQLVDPVSYALTTLLQSLLLLLGGFVMCFVTSWRLSMLAFTTVLPVVHVTSVYASWSSKINKQIYQHYSDSGPLPPSAYSRGPPA